MSTNSANEPKNVSVEQFQNGQKALLERIGELEKQLKERPHKQEEETEPMAKKALVDEQFAQLQNGQKAILERINELEKKGQPGNYVSADEFNLRMKAIETFFYASICWGEIPPKEDEKGKYVSAEQFTQFQNDQKTLLERIGELEKQLKERPHKQEEETEPMAKKALVDEQFAQLQNGQKAILERINELEKKGQPGNYASTSKANDHQFAQFQNDQILINCWDDNFCQKQLQIHSLKVVHTGNGDRSVFAKHSIFSAALPSSSVLFYFEISFTKMNRTAAFGFALKNTGNLSGSFFSFATSYAYGSKGKFYVDGAKTFGNPKIAFSIGETVGCGVLANRKLLFTKNGHCLDSTAFSLSPSADCAFLFPFVTLLESGDEIEANFGPEFMFDLATLMK
ncbi:hypothetical protein niasHS_006398 [Heterodera schachtii]|uniref:B30.2/SPRY domain-containing protein n=1 Tax=Heterodera schachtii TaxID=97005 RepID=A0ABD2JH46_HETSC